MILVDTSVWVDHFNHGDVRLQTLLRDSQVVIHPMVLGELACGHLRNRQELMLLWQSLPQAVEASHVEVMQFIERHQLMGSGIGFIDFHLMASTLLTSNCALWTRDNRLNAAAETLKINFEP